MGESSIRFSGEAFTAREVIRRLRPSRRELLTLPLLAPVALAQRETDGAVACCSGRFEPNDIFANIPIWEDQKQAKAGDLSATIRIGYAFFTGSAGRTDIERSRAYFLAASRVPAGAAWLGYLEASKFPLRGSAARARASFVGLSQAAEVRDPVGMTLLGRVYEEGLAGFTPQATKGKQYYVTASEDFALAKTFLANLFFRSGDVAGAISLLKAAVQAGDTTAMVTLADVYSKKKDLGPTQTSEIRLLLTAASDRGNRNATYLLARQYRDRKPGFVSRPAYWAGLFHKAALLGHKGAAIELSAELTASPGAGFWSRKGSLEDLGRPLPPAGPGRGRSGRLG